MYCLDAIFNHTHIGHTQLQLLLNIKIAIRLEPLLHILAVPFQPMSLGRDGVQTLANSSVEALLPS
jgi:hypothetical protein